MPDITKGSPQFRGPGPAPTQLGSTVRKVAKAAFADPGEWYSAEVPEGTNTSNLRSMTSKAILSLVAELSTSEGRVWIRFRP